MLKFKLTPKFMANAIIKVKDLSSLTFKEGDYIIVICPDVGKMYSTVTRLDKIIYEPSEENEIIIDKKIVGRMGEGDLVVLTRYNPPHAEYLKLAVPDTSKMFPGNWTRAIQDSFLDKVLDLGFEVNFAVPSKLGSSFFTRGTVIKTFPQPPIVVKPQTQIFIEKHPTDQIISIK
ncbi:MAG: hypothetical protein ACTSR3_20475, partial [Candidatus Helarchaeota archaeon]